MLCFWRVFLKLACVLPVKISWQWHFPINCSVFWTSKIFHNLRREPLHILQSLILSECRQCANKNLIKIKNACWWTTTFVSSLLLPCIDAVFMKIEWKNVSKNKTAVTTSVGGGGEEKGDMGRIMQQHHYMWGKNKKMSLHLHRRWYQQLVLHFAACWLLAEGETPPCFPCVALAFPR